MASPAGMQDQGSSRAGTAQAPYALQLLPGLFGSDQLSDAVLVFVPKQDASQGRVPDGAADRQEPSNASSEQERALKRQRLRASDADAAADQVQAQVPVQEQAQEQDQRQSEQADAGTPCNSKEEGRQREAIQQQQGPGAGTGDSQEAGQQKQQQQQQQPPPAWPRGSLVLPVHKLVLFAGSPYWQARIMNASSMAGDAFTEPGSGRAVLVEREMGPKEMEVAEVLVRFLYTNQLQGPGGEGPLTAQQLLKVYQLAQRFDIPSCREACMSAMAALAPDQLELADVCPLLELLQSANQRHWAPVKGLCTQRLVQQFRDVNRMLNSDQSLQDFKSLSLAAVLLWAQSDLLQVVASENDVAVVLHTWVKEQPEASLSEAQQEQLSACVRVKQLTHSVRMRLLKWDWFRSRDRLLNLCVLLDSNKATAQSRLEASVLGRLGIPAAWVAGPRARLARAEAAARRTLSVTIPRHELEEEFGKALAGQVRQVRAPGTWLEGQVYGLKVRLSMPQHGKVQVSQMLSCKSSASGVPVYIHAEYGFKQQQQPGGRTSWHVCLVSEVHILDCHSFGPSNSFVGKPQFSSVEEMAAQGYLVEGQLRLRCRILDCL